MTNVSRPADDARAHLNLLQTRRAITQPSRSYIRMKRFIFINGSVTIILVMHGLKISSLLTKFSCHHKKNYAPELIHQDPRFYIFLLRCMVTLIVDRWLGWRQSQGLRRVYRNLHITDAYIFYLKCNRYVSLRYDLTLIAFFEATAQNLQPMQLLLSRTYIQL